MNVPNLLSILRIILTPVLVYALFNLSIGLFLFLLAIAGLTDILDGYFARKLNQATKNGALLDLLADRLLVLSLFIALVIKFDISFLAVIFLLFRDIIVVLGRILLFFKFDKSLIKSEIRPTLLGKLTTALQLITIASIATTLFQTFFIYIAIWFSLITGLHYLYIGVRKILVEKASRNKKDLEGNMSKIKYNYKEKKLHIFKIPVEYYVDFCIKLHVHTFQFGTFGSTPSFDYDQVKNVFIVSFLVGENGEEEARELKKFVDDNFNNNN